jgi:hypothetical protein
MQEQMMPMGNQMMPMQEQMMPMGNQMMPMQEQMMPMGNQMMPMQEQMMPMGNQMMPMQMPAQGYQPYQPQPYPSYPPVTNDCGCGGPKPVHNFGGYDVYPGYRSSQMMHGGYPVQQPVHPGYGYPAYGQFRGVAPIYGHSYEQAHPLGFEPAPLEPFEESSEFNG